MRISDWSSDVCSSDLLVPYDLAFTGLMHDTSEALTNDITTPLKQRVPDFKTLEVSIETEMARQFGFQFPLPAPVNYADLPLLKVAKDLIKQDFSDWECLPGGEEPPLPTLCLHPPPPENRQNT